MPSATELAIILRAVDRASGPLRQVSESIQRVGESARGIGESLRGAGEGMLIQGALIGEMGEKMYGALERVVEPAIASADALTAVAAATSLTAEAQEKLTAASVAYSNAHVRSEEQFKATSLAMLQQKEALGGIEGALSATTTAMKLAGLTGSDAVEVGQVLTRVFQTMGNSATPAADQIKQIGDQLATARSIFALSGDGLSEYNAGLAALGGLAGAVHAPISEVLTVLGGSALIGGSRAIRGFAQGFGELLANSKKMREIGLAPTNSPIQMLEEVKARIAGLNDMSKASFVEKAFGPGAARVILPMLGHLDEYKKKADAIANSQGALDKGLGVREASVMQQLTKVSQQLHNLAVSVGSAVLPTISAALGKITPILASIAAFAEKHSTITKWVLIIGGVIAGVTILAAGFLALAGTAAIVVGAIVSGFGIVAGAVSAVVAAVGGFIATWGLVIAAVVAVGAVIWAFGPKLFESGKNLILYPANGIKAGAHWAIDAIKGVVSSIRDHLPFSPARVGPLKDLNRVRIVQTIAEQIKPAAATAAIRRVAASVALAGAISVPIGATASTGPAAIARDGAPSISITISATFNSDTNDPASFEQMLDKHAKLFVEKVSAELTRRERKKF